MFEKPKKILGLVRDKVVNPTVERANQVTGLVLGALAVHRSVVGVHEAVTKLRKKVNNNATAR